MSINVRDASVYTNLSGLQSIRQLGKENSPEALKQVAVQFESMFLNIMLKNMRAGEETLFADNYLRSSEMNFHRENLDNQLALHMANSGGFGLAESLHRQLMQRYQPDAVAAEGKSVVVDLEQVRRYTGSVASAHADEPMVRWRTRSIQAPQIAPAVLEDISPAQQQPEQFESPQDFVEVLLPVARRYARELGVDPRVLLAQSALETGWGQKMIRGTQGEASYNLFGIKANDSWQGKRVSVSTLEFRDGVFHRETASFRAYNSYEESFADYVRMIRSQPRYAEALQNAADPAAYSMHLQRAGYATDPAYASKIREVMKSPSLKQASISMNAEQWVN